MVAGTELSDLRKLTVVKLRERLSKLGLPTSGLKADLVERLFKYYKEEEDDEGEGPGDRGSMDTMIPPPKEPQRTALQMRLQQMAGQPTKESSQSQAPPTQPPSKPPPSIPHSQPPPLMSQQVQPPRPPMMQQPQSMAPPRLGPPQIPPPGPPGPPGKQGPPVPPGPPPPGMQSQPPRPPTSQPMVQPPHMGGPPQGPPPGPPPQQMNQPRPPMGMPPQMAQPNPPRPQMPPPPQMMQPPPVQEPDMQEKIAMQSRMLEQERKQQEQQRIMEQQQKERMAIQRQAMLLQQQQQTADDDDSNTDLMEKVRQQQIMLEQQKQKERLEQQQQAMMEQQNQAIKKQEEERRRKEAELLRQQQIALMEAQRDEQQKHMREERGPPPQRPPMEPFNPRPDLPHGAPRGMMPPPFMPPNSSSASIPPLLPPHSNDGPRGPPRGMPQEEKEEKEEDEMKLAPALEKVLAFKDVRAQEVGLTPEEIEKLNMPEEKTRDEEEDDEIEMVDMEDDEEGGDEEEVTQTDSKKESKNKRKKKKKKKAKKNRTMKPTKRRIVIPLDKKDEVQIEYVQEQLDLDPTDPNYFTFSKIFEMFKISEEPKEVPKVIEAQPEKPTEPKSKTNFDPTDEDDEEMEEKPESDVPKLSKKKLKKLTRLSVAQLKQLVQRPDVVEMHDVTAQDPRLCVHLKATRNTVPVPRHWCFKRKYLQGKRGIEKPPFELPDYIQATGITEMRAALAEKEDQKNLKAKMREKVRPKMGKIDIDYQKLHDAFFRWQTKPKMTIHGDLYYEGKEFETRLKEKKPGNITDDLKTALGMPIGPGSEKVPPPWLIAMQRYGPPPSYPNLKIAGLSAPIPEGCSFGYHAGGWGKPPVDENGKPLYGDVFGTKSTDFETVVQEDDIDKSHWGELESESESESESEEEEEEEGPEESGLITPAEGLVTPSGITSIPVGMETPDMIELRKRRIEDAMDQGGETPALYQVLPEKKSAVGGAMMGSAHIYDVPGLGAKKPGEKGATEGVEIALNPEELDLDTAAMQAKYDQTIREQQSQLEKEDLSDMVAEHAAKQKKRKKKQEESGKAAKKYKEFKF